MNVFQKQLIVAGKCLAELSLPSIVGRPEPQVRVTIEVFEADRKDDGYCHCGNFDPDDYAVCMNCGGRE
jgi:hypothetical protein